MISIYFGREKGRGERGHEVQVLMASRGNDNLHEEANIPPSIIRKRRKKRGEALEFLLKVYQEMRQKFWRGREEQR